MKKQLIRTAPSQIEKTARTRRMIRPMRCASCGTTQSFRRIVKFGGVLGKRGKRCSKCERLTTILKQAVYPSSVEKRLIARQDICENTSSPIRVM